MNTKYNLAQMRKNSTYIAIIKVILGIAMLFASAQIIIPIKPVPITMQTIAVCLIALTYSTRLAFITILSYIIAGIMGIPMFHAFRSGLEAFAGYTGGYLFGFLIAVPLMSGIKQYLPKNFLSITFICIIGHIAIYFFGVLWLATFIGLKQALYSGLIIYIPSGIVKIAIFACCYSYILNHKIAKL
jgi:biotin transport system substrate-specific component